MYLYSPRHPPPTALPGGNETALSIPKSLWMTYETAMESPVGPFCEGQAGMCFENMHSTDVASAS